MSHKKLTPEILAEIQRLTAATYTANLRGYVSREDLSQDAAVLWDLGHAETPADAVRMAYNANREERDGSGENIRFAYLSASHVNADGETITLGDSLADSLADQGETQHRDAAYTRSDLVAAVAAVRDAKTVHAHGEDLARRGRANGQRGVVNDARVLAEVEAVGGEHYGYAAKVARSLGIKPNAVYQAVHRAKKRTIRGGHSSRD